MKNRNSQKLEAITVSTLVVGVDIAKETQWGGLPSNGRVKSCFGNKLSISVGNLTELSPPAP